MAHPHKDYDPNGPIKRLREICLALPEATEKEAWGECTFRAGGKMFAMTDNNHHESGRVAVWVNAPPMAQETLVASDPVRYFKPPYVGHKGWVGVRLDVKVDWDELAAILRDGYLMSAPDRLVGGSVGRLDALSVSNLDRIRSAKPKSRKRLVSGVRRKLQSAEPG
ncbi:MAG TPA: MmcQ/YjbR family DNA-binding protein [Candidatus Binataceae bacterium]|nr:MmcQ/YjbR family DNA-binding protein [Candidatus Binataceae bacterium]